MSEYKIIIRPNKKFNFFDFKEIWQYRELLYIFAWRDIKVRYKQTILGVLWVILQPIVSMIIFTILFGNLAKVPSGNLPYALFVLCGLVYWTFFSTTLSHINESMLANEGIIKKIYFPKIILPIASLLTHFLDLFINILLLISFAVILGHFPKLSFILLFTAAFIITSFNAIGVGLFFSSLNVKYRDVRYIMPYIFQVLFYFTPIIYPTTIISERNRLIMALNPMTTVVELIRSSFDRQYTLDPRIIVISLISTVGIFLIGLLYFQKTENFIADIL